MKEQQNTEGNLLEKRITARLWFQEHDGNEYRDTGDVVEVDVTAVVLSLDAEEIQRLEDDTDGTNDLVCALDQGWDGPQSDSAGDQTSAQGGQALHGSYDLKAKENMNIAKIDPAVVEAVRKRGHEQSDIARMTPEFAFKEYCEWHGLIGWGDTLISTLDSLRASAA